MNGSIFYELKKHIPFTVFGALTGIILMAGVSKIPYESAHHIFYILHPAHVVLSALVTASMYKNYKCTRDTKKCNLFALVAVGFVGSVGVATVSDSIIPYYGELLLKMPHAEAHIGFIERWWIVLPLSAAGIAVAYFHPTTKFPHAAHVLVSTWASLFHIVMAGSGALTVFAVAGIFVFLFAAVWVPCCASDIVFPLMFVGKSGGKKHDE